MWVIFNFYRFYISVLAGAAVFLSVQKTWWAWLGTTLIFRCVWFIIENRIQAFLINRFFLRHCSEFKQLTGPYGIRLINQAEQNPAIKKSLSEVFTPNINKLKDVVKQLEMMDTLFRAGLRPEGDSYQIHDLKLKYAKHRLEKEIADV